MAGLSDADDSSIHSSSIADAERILAATGTAEAGAAEPGDGHKYCEVRENSMSIYGTQFLERIQFFNGERLFASDLQALESFNREMRWLHNQSLHQAGVGSGFSVMGNVGDSQVVITPGYALDSQGEEIILTQKLVLPIPSVADNGSGGSVFYDLTVSYPQDSDLKASETRVGTCNCP